MRAWRRLRKRTRAYFELLRYHLSHGERVVYCFLDELEGESWKRGILCANKRGKLFTHRLKTPEGVTYLLEGVEISRRSPITIAGEKFSTIVLLVDGHSHE